MSGKKRFYWLGGLDATNGMKSLGASKLSKWAYRAYCDGHRAGMQKIRGIYGK